MKFAPYTLASHWATSSKKNLSREISGSPPMLEFSRRCHTLTHTPRSSSSRHPWPLDTAHRILLAAGSRGHRRLPRPLPLRFSPPAALDFTLRLPQPVHVPPPVTSAIPSCSMARHGYGRPATNSAPLPSVATAQRARQYCSSEVVEHVLGGQARRVIGAALHLHGVGIKCGDSDEDERGSSRRKRRGACVGTCGKLVDRRHGQQLLERASKQLRAFVEHMLLLNGTP
jgi:hypothetical protein